MPTQSSIAQIRLNAAVTTVEVVLRVGAPSGRRRREDSSSSPDDVSEGARLQKVEAMQPRSHTVSVVLSLSPVLPTPHTYFPRRRGILRSGICYRRLPLTSRSSTSPNDSVMIRRWIALR
jgi:hypothetical protein